MGYVVKIPKLGLEMDSGTVTAWFVEEGEAVEAGDVIAEIESEKTTGKVEARENGVLRRRLLEEGESAEPGAPMGIVAEADADISDLEASLEGEVPDAEAATEAAAGVEAPTPDAEATTEAAASSEDVKASPRARKRADELGVDLASVDGTGPQGSITEEDVEAAAETEGETIEDVKASPRARKRADELGVDLASVDGTGPKGSITEADVEAAAEDRIEGIEERPLDGMRRTIASRLGQSYREAVHVTEHRVADAEALRAAAKAAAAVHDESVTVTDVLLAAISAALEDHPAFNATFEEDVHRLHGEHNLCVAVDVEDGLLAPVIRGVDDLEIDELARKRATMTDRALSGQYTMDDLRGGTFTISNLGLLGVESFDPVINPPQVAILGVNALDERPVARNGEVVVRRTLPLSLSFDHRLVDGADAARFLETLVGHLEEPWPLLEGVTPADVPSDVHWRDDGAAAAVAELPERDVTAHVRPDLSGSVAAGSAEWPFDVTPEWGGGRAPTPVDYFLGALSACLAASIGIQADMRDVDFSGIDVGVVGAPADGNESVEAITIDVRLDVEDDVDDDALERIVAGGERTCHVAELLREDLEMNLAWSRT
ncbi:2-oxo acid dehydrogenase subunit E2 [Natronobeatus ordinarius]|uniref:2-oxo acid dehydrogenase subunit E2 n=1 Tax=Natronobeatus ordinarius TaxID=2963433 RepID=UPI0020CDC3CE|nr:2-oxo acid dehydrogenase subunit E2 [Natronobeatus ordinarius]